MTEAINRFNHHQVKNFKYQAVYQLNIKKKTFKDEKDRQTKKDTLLSFIRNLREDIILV